LACAYTEVLERELERDRIWIMSWMAHEEGESQRLGEGGDGESSDLVECPPYCLCPLSLSGVADGRELSKVAEGEEVDHAEGFVHSCDLSQSSVDPSHHLRPDHRLLVRDDVPDALESSLSFEEHARREGQVLLGLAGLNPPRRVDRLAEDVVRCGTGGVHAKDGFGEREGGSILVGEGSVIDCDAVELLTDGGDDEGLASSCRTVDGDAHRHGGILTIGRTSSRSVVGEDASEEGPLSAGEFRDVALREIVGIEHDALLLGTSSRVDGDQAGEL
jgi:hypothetical protein